MNLLTYFLIVLGGFGVVWGFRLVYYWRVQKREMSDFEYAAFSAIWGSVLMLIVLPAFDRTPGMLNVIQQEPFTATPSVFIVGFMFGILSGFAAREIKQIKSKK